MLYACLLDRKKFGKDGPTISAIRAREGKMERTKRKKDVWPNNHSKSDYEDQRSIYPFLMKIRRDSNDTHKKASGVFETLKKPRIDMNKIVRKVVAVVKPYPSFLKWHSWFSQCR